MYSFSDVRKRIFDSQKIRSRLMPAYGPKVFNHNAFESSYRDFTNAACTRLGMNKEDLLQFIPHIKTTLVCQSCLFTVNNYGPRTNNTGA